MFVKILPGCIACGVCESLCPDVFTVFDSCTANNEKVPGNEAACRDASAACPVDVIKIEE